MLEGWNQVLRVAGVDSIILVKRPPRWSHAANRGDKADVHRTAVRVQRQMAGGIDSSDRVRCKAGSIGENGRRSRNQ